MRRQYVKFCDLLDFAVPEVRSRIREIVPRLEPPADLHRKYWEYAMLTLFLEDVGRLDETARVLSVGAGHEEVLYWLANHVGCVVATDIYGDGAFAGGEADVSMLTSPEMFAPYAYRRDRLEVWKMDARALEFADESFDAAFSLSPIEHFGSARDVAQAAREIGRVLRPGGFAFLVTECFVDRSVLNSKLLQSAIRVATLGRRCPKATPRRRAFDVFTVRELKSRIIRPSGLELVQSLDRTISSSTRRDRIYMLADGEFEAPGGPFPHILLEPRGSLLFLGAHGAAFTSVALALRKASETSA